MSQVIDDRSPGQASGEGSRLRDFLAMIKFSHTLFALPFALLGGALAAHTPNGWRGRFQDWVGILLCMAAARSAAMAFNRLVDRRFDASNPRTATRHLPSGRLSVASVVGFTVACSAGFILATTLFLPNRWPLYLSVPVLGWILAYSYTKRFTSLAHFWLGISLSLTPIAAWIALRGNLEWPPLLLALAVFLWVSGFDIIYSCQDVDFDRRAGLHSVPRALGVSAALRLAALCHLLMLLPLTVLGLAYPLGWIYYSGVAAVAVLLFYEHSLVRPEDLTNVNLAFFQVNIAISMGLLFFGVADLLI